MGGSALQWRVRLPEALEPGTVYEVNLGMRKIGAPDVTIGWELIVADPDGASGNASKAADC